MYLLSPTVILLFAVHAIIVRSGHTGEAHATGESPESNEKINNAISEGLNKANIDHKHIDDDEDPVKNIQDQYKENTGVDERDLENVEEVAQKLQNMTMEGNPQNLTHHSEIVQDVKIVGEGDSIRVNLGRVKTENISFVAKVDEWKPDLTTEGPDKVEPILENTETNDTDANGTGNAAWAVNANANFIQMIVPFILVLILTVSFV